MFSDLSPTALALTLIVVTVGVLLVATVPGRSAPLLRRMARRQIARRPMQSVMMIAGLALAAVFITAPLGLQDSFQASSTSLRLS